MIQYTIQLHGEVYNEIGVEADNETILQEFEVNLREETLMLESSGGSEFLIDLLASLRVGEVNRIGGSLSGNSY